MNLLPHLKLFDSCVKPILLYSSEVWATISLVKQNTTIESNYANFSPNKIQIKFAKFLLGVNKGAVNNAVLSELGLFPLSLSALKNTINFWLHIINMDSESMVVLYLSPNYVHYNIQYIFT